MFTDILDNPINVGDEIAYSVVTSRSSSTMQRAQVADLIRLVEKPPGPNGQWYSTGTNSRIPWVREDKQFEEWPTEYWPRRTAAGAVDPAKCYVLHVYDRRQDGTRETRKKFLKRNNHVIVVTDLV